MAEFTHEPVMLEPIVALFAPVPSGVFIDATLGGGGHASALLTSRDDVALIGIDRDPTALAAAATRLAPFGERVRLEHARFDELGRVVATATSDRWFGEDREVSAVLFDLGVSSPQFDHADRGFSYRGDGRLDMRMNPADPVSAHDIVNGWDQRDLALLLRDAGDERFASRIAEAIVAARPVETTGELADIVRSAIPAATRRTGGHPAKRTFQALRIAVNDELDQISPAIEQAIEALVPGGRGAVLSYHSGEDRLVKYAIADAESGGCTCPPRLPCACGATPSVVALRPRMRRPDEAETERNPRSTSARLRAFEKQAVA